MEYVELLYKKGQIKNLDVSDAYKSLIYLYFKKNQAFYRTADGQLKCKYEKLNAIYVLVKAQDEMMQKAGVELFDKYKLYPKFNELVELDNEYYDLIEKLIINDEQYSKVLAHKIIIKCKANLLSMDNCTTKHGNNYLKLKVKVRNRVKYIYCFDSVAKYQLLQLGEINIEYSDEKYPKLINANQLNNNLDYLIPVDIII